MVGEKGESEHSPCDSIEAGWLRDFGQVQTLLNFLQNGDRANDSIWTNFK